MLSNTKFSPVTFFRKKTASPLPLTVENKNKKGLHRSRLFKNDKMGLLANAGLYEAGWFAVVLGIAWGSPWIGSALGIVTILAHLAIVTDRRIELQRIAAAVFIGVVVETINSKFGIYEVIGANQLNTTFAPWLLVIWAGLATAFYRSLRWLSGRYLLAIPIGALAGPIAFWAGERLGAIVMTREPELLGLLALQWAIALPLLTWTSDRIASGRQVVGLKYAATVAAALILLTSDIARAETNRESNCLAATGSELSRRGEASYEYLGFIDVFDATLYDDSNKRDSSVLAAVPKCLVLRYKRDFEAEDFADVTIRGIKENVSPQELARLMPRIERFNRLYRNVNEGDRYALTFVPGKGTVLSYNGRPRGTIEGADFAAALFSIWLGPNPMDDELRRALLGNI